MLRVYCLGFRVQGASLKVYSAEADKAKRRPLSPATSSTISGPGAFPKGNEIPIRDASSAGIRAFGVVRELGH